MRADALLVVADPIFFNRTTQLVVLAARHAIPTLYSRREFTATGGLMSYGPNINDSYRRSASTPPAYSRAKSPVICRSNCQPSSNW
jgi:hypothetical protein